jgi:hypothetical protein
MPYLLRLLILVSLIFSITTSAQSTADIDTLAKEILNETIFNEGRVCTVSPWSYNGKLFCLSEGGVTYLFNEGDWRFGA